MRRRKLSVKKIIVLVILAVILSLVFNSCLRTTFGKDISTTDNTINANDNISNKTLNEEIEKKDKERAKTEEELLKYKLKEQEEKARQDKIKALQNPEIIGKELEQVGKLITYEGELDYNDQIIHKGFLNSRKLTLKLLYKFGIAIDLNYIVIDEYIEDTVVIRIPKNTLVLEYIQVIPEESYVNGEKSLLAKHFKAEEIKVILDNAQNTTVEKINDNDEYFTKAEESLKENLEKLILKLGYKRVIFTY